MHVGCSGRRERERQVTARFVPNNWYIWALKLHLASGTISALPPMTGRKNALLFWLYRATGNSSRPSLTGMGHWGKKHVP